MGHSPAPEPGTALAPVPAAPLPAVGVETASTAVAASAKATIEARYLVALRNPRDWDTVRVKLLAACARPRFAVAARYAKPVGTKKIIGPSIRFAEEAVRHMGNILIQTTVTFDSAEQRIVSVSVTDLEANVAYPMDVTLDKVVERSSVRPGQSVLGTRTNTGGNRVYLVAASEDEFLTKQNAMVSKAVRQGALRILPSDILEECMERVADVVRDEDAKDPTAARKRIMDAFYGLGVMPDQLADYLGKSLDVVNPAELTLLRTIFTAMSEGEATWDDVLQTRRKPKAEGDAPAATPLAEKLAATARARKPKDAEPAAPVAPAPVAEDLDLDRKLAAEEETHA